MQTPIIERAYQLARSGQCATVGEVKAALRSERYDHVEQQLSGAALYAALREICAASRVDEAADRARRDADRNRRKKLALSKPTGS
jgi:hypothetical protein